MSCHAPNCCQHLRNSAHSRIMHGWEASGTRQPVETLMCELCVFNNFTVTSLQWDCHTALAHRLFHWHRHSRVIKHLPSHWEHTHNHNKHPPKPIRGKSRWPKKTERVQFHALSKMAPTIPQRWPNKPQPERESKRGGLNLSLTFAFFHERTVGRGRSGDKYDRKTTQGKWWPAKGSKGALPLRSYSVRVVVQTLCKWDPLSGSPRQRLSRLSTIMLRSVTAYRIIQLGQTNHKWTASLQAD